MVSGSPSGPNSGHGSTAEASRFHRAHGERVAVGTELWARLHERRDRRGGATSRSTAFQIGSTKFGPERPNDATIAEATHKAQGRAGGARYLTQWRLSRADQSGVAVLVTGIIAVAAPGGKSRACARPSARIAC
jgi:hypothetical protein